MSNLFSIVKAEDAKSKTEPYIMPDLTSDKAVLPDTKKNITGQFNSLKEYNATTNKSDFVIGGGFSFNLFSEDDELERDRVEGEQFLENIKKRAENIEKEAFNQGLEMGILNGRKEVKNEIETILVSLHKLLSEIKNIKRELHDKNENDILNLVFIIARKVIRREVELDADVVAGVIRQALLQLIDKDEVSIKLNPEDISIAEKHEEYLKKSVDGLKGITIEADQSIERGGCLVETKFGSVDARIEPQLIEIEKALRQSNAIT